MRQNVIQTDTQNAYVSIKFNYRQNSEKATGILENISKVNNCYEFYYKNVERYIYSILHNVYCRVGDAKKIRSVLY